MRKYHLIVSALCFFLAFASANMSHADLSIFSAKNALIDFILEKLGKPGTFELTTTSIETPDGGGTTLVGFKVSDEEGAWITADEIFFKFDANQLFAGAVDISELRVTNFKMMRLPSQSPSAVAETQQPTTPPPASGNRFSITWPRSPLRIFIREFLLTHAEISDNVLPQAIAFAGGGTLRDEGNVQAFDIAMTRRDDIEGDIVIAYERDFANNTLSIILDADEAPNGLVGSILGLPQDSAVVATIEADGPPHDWRMQLSTEAENVFKAVGTLDLDYQDALEAWLDVIVTPGLAAPELVRAAFDPNITLSATIREDTSGVVVITDGALRSRNARAGLTGFYNQRTGAMNLQLDADFAAGLSAILPNAQFSSAAFKGALTGDVRDLTASGDFQLRSFESSSADIGFLQASGALGYRNGVLRFGFVGDAADLRIDRLSSDIIGRAAVRVRGDATMDKVTLAEANLSSEALNVSVNGDVDLAADTGGYGLELSIALDQLNTIAGLYDVALQGDLAAQGTLSGPLEAPVFDAIARFNELRFGHKNQSPAVFRGGEAKLVLALADGQFQGPLQLKVDDSPFGAAQVAATVTTEETAVLIAGINGDVLQAVVDGDLRLDRATGLWTGALDLQSRSWQRLGRQIGIALDGAGSARLQFATDQGLQIATVQAHASPLTLSGFRFPDIGLKAKIIDLFGEQRIESQGVIKQATLGVMPPLDLKLHLAGDPTDAKFSLIGERIAHHKGRKRLTVGVDVAGSIKRTGAPIVVSVQRFIAGIDEDRLSLESPATIVFARSGWQTTDLALKLPRNGGLAGKVGAQGGVPFGRLALDNFSLALIRDYFGVPVATGWVKGVVDFDARHGVGAVALDVYNLAFEGATSEKAIRATIDADWMNGGISAEFVGRQAFENPMKAKISVPLVYRQGFRVPPNGALRGALQWRGDLAEIGALIPPSDHLIAGPGLVDLNLAGTVADPIVSGDLTVTNGRYDHLAFGTILTNLTIRSQLADNADNDAIALIFSADDGSTGTIAGNAKVSLFSGFAVNASAVIDRAVLLRRDDISARLSGQTEVTGNVNDLLIAADLKVDGAEVDLGQTGGPTIVDLGQMYDTEDDADALIETGMTSSTFRATLDINIESPEGIHIFGRGLTSEWSMGLAVAGDAAAPTITGEIRQISGHLDLLGARFDLSRGALRFTGAPDAALDILFTRRADSVRGGIVVSGRASDPQVNFASSPSLAPSEVLPRVIFGHPQQALSPAQTAQLAAGIATLVTGKSGVAGFVAGIGRVDVGTNGLNAGRYVGDGVYVGARQNDDGSGGAVVIELEVIDDVILDAETSQFGGSSVGVSWRHDF